MNAQPPTTPVRPTLPIPGTLAEVYALLWNNRDGFLRVVLIPAAASFLLTVIAYNITEEGVLLVLLAADLIPTTLFAVGWHRLILLGPQQAFGAPLLRWGNRETAYLGRSIVLMLGSLMAMAVPVSIAMAVAQRSVLGHLLILFLSVTTLFIMVRLALVLPASAVDASYGFAQSWNDTTARGFRLVAIVLLVATPMFLLLQIFNSMVELSGLANAAPFTMLLLNSVGSYLVLAALLTVFSLAFGRLSNWPNGGPATLPAAES